MTDLGWPIFTILGWIVTNLAHGQPPPMMPAGGRVNCANYRDMDQLASPLHGQGFSFLPETPSGADKILLGSGYVVGDPHGQDCLITIEDTTTAGGQNGDHRIPSSTSSAIAVTPIGNYILYGTGAPYRGIAAYALECRSNHPISEDMLFLPSDYFVKQITVSNTGTDHQHTTALIVTLNYDQSPTAFEITTAGDRFRLSPCITVFPHQHVTDVALVDRNKATIIIFSNDNLDSKSDPKDRYAPIYLSAYNFRNATLCGFVPVEHTKKVELWIHEGNIIATFAQQMPRSKRSFIRWFSIKITGRICKAEPWALQSVMGALPWETGFSVLPPGNPSLLFPFTVDNILCGVEDIKIVQTPTFTALAVAIANPETCLENTCSSEDTLTFEQSNSASSIRVCGCAYAIKTSFAIVFSKTAQKFALDIAQPSGFQLLRGAPELATEIQTIILPCCALVQLCSTAGTCELFTLRMDKRSSEFDAGRTVGTRLPSLVQSSAVGTCRTNTVAVSYSGMEASTKPTIHKFSCTNFFEGVGQRANPEDQPRFHLALHNASSGTHFPVSESLPGNRRHSATPFYVVPPPNTEPNNGLDRNMADLFRVSQGSLGTSSSSGRDRYFGDAPAGGQSAGPNQLVPGGGVRYVEMQPPYSGYVDRQQPSWSQQQRPLGMGEPHLQSGGSGMHNYNPYRFDHPR
ncbi:hypothetical protein BV898_11084 [Hypsibius exemplaris]|uniref:CUB domain-containing protein n=1 Tax=Hypsibius exemplaris TaxID=2072580 RepID=A0A1W0WHM9_HYPEX|nr:hypothetical protein BV898_11084 [Hypsibius exemplaris]